MAASRKRRRNPYTNVAWYASPFHTQCKRRKVKCSGEKPCAGCQQVQAICLYERSTRFRSGRRSSMVSSRSRDDSVGAPLSGGLAKRLSGNAPSGIPEDAPIDLDVNYSPQPIRPGSSDYYLSLAQQLLVTASPTDGHGGAQSQPAPRMAEDMRKLIQERPGRASRSLLSIIPLSRWLEVLDTYEEEIGLLYPFLDVTDLRNQLRDAPSHSAGHETGEEVRLSHKLEDVLILVLAVMAVLEEPDISSLSDDYTEQVMANTWRSLHTGNVTDHDVSLSILMWSAYTLDRRWSFGTGLPFAIHDSDIDYDMDFMDESLSSVYLKAMVSYCRIAAEVRDSALGMPSPNHAKDAARDLLDFKVGEWRRNLPLCLQFHADMDFDPLKGTRGQYRLRLLLYLRANQMRIIIHRKSALRSGNDAIDTSSVNAMVEVAQDTIRVLAKLSQASNIYHAQQKTFNHFLESALSALLLVTCRSKVMAGRSCTAEVQLALDVIQRLSTSSSITRRLANKLKCFTTNNRVAGHQANKSSPDIWPQQPARYASGSTDQVSNAHNNPTTFRRPSEVSADRSDSMFDGPQSNNSSSAVLVPRHDQTSQAIMIQPINDFSRDLPSTNEHMVTNSMQLGHPDLDYNERLSSLLDSVGYGTSEISPSSLSADLTSEMAGGLGLPMTERWDGLMSDLGDFWIDYDRMITF
ncbi:transcriptional regulatory protein [Seiridium cupressi]